MSAGFFGEVSSSELLTYGALASQTGLSAGYLENNTESTWLKFALDGKTLFVAKKAARGNVAWNHLNASNLVFGETVITLGTNDYKVRLLTGADNHPTAIPRGAEFPTAANVSEWDRLLYPVHVEDPLVQEWGINYTNADLAIDTSGGNRYWCQEGDSSGQRVNRGAIGVGYFSTYGTGSQSNLPLYKWRPVLELIE